MVEKRFVVKLASDGDSDAYYNTAQGSVPSAFAGSMFKDQADAKCVSKCKKGSVIYELEPKEQKPPKPKKPWKTILMIAAGGIFVTRFVAETGFMAQEASLQCYYQPVSYSGQVPVGIARKC